MDGTFWIEFTDLMTSEEELQLVMTPRVAWAVFQNLQLALSHPDNTSELADMARTVAKTIEEQIATTPALQQVARMGWQDRPGLKPEPVLTKGGSYVN